MDKELNITKTPERHFPSRPVYFFKNVEKDMMWALLN